MYSSCKKCDDYEKKLRQPSTHSRTGVYPTTLELATMVNLEYYYDIGYRCLHAIPRCNDANSNVCQMIEFLEERHWEAVTRTNNEGFKCSSFINRSAKQLVIVHRGTEGLKNLSQLTADIRIAMNRITSQIVATADWHTTQSMLNNAMILDERTRKFVRNDYSVTITGHSLGGWLAQLCTLLCKHPKFFPVGPRGTFSFGNNTMLDMNQSNDLHCVAFDSPGANAVLERLRDDPEWLNAKDKRDVEVCLENLDITVYLANPNLVNTCGKHTKNVKKIDVMSSASWLRRLNPIASHSMDGILAYFQNHPDE